GEVKTFTASNFVVEREFCMETGLIAGSNCQDTSVGYYKKTNIPPTCSGEHLKTEIDTMLEGLGRRDVAVIVTEGIDIADYEAVTGHKYTYINQLIRSYR